MTATKAKATQHDRVALLARDMVIATISIGQLPGDEEATRHFVRLARAFYSEVDKPTQPKKRVPAPPRDEDEFAEAGGE